MKKQVITALILLFSSHCYANDTWQFNNAEGCLHLQVIGEKLLRVQINKNSSCKQTPAFAKSAYVPAKQYNNVGIKVSDQVDGEDTIKVIETDRMQIKVHPDVFCLEISSKTDQQKSSKLCPKIVKDENGMVLNIDRENVTQLYGLGQQHPQTGEPDGDWLKLGKRTAGSQYGNQMVVTEGGLIGNTQFPVLYALGDKITPWFLFLDNYYPQYWNFRQAPMNVGIRNTDELVFYFQMGESLADLRRKYMQLVGKPLVPSRKYFGLWVSEYGYDNWQEVDDIKQSLIKHKFPVDGFVMDLQWFGGIEEGSDTSSMGKLSWDQKQFPRPAEKIHALKNEHIGLMLIEESYVNRGLPEHATLQEKGYLVMKKDGSPVYLDQDSWWGKGGMIDWTNPQAGLFWHDWKRQPLIDMGIMGHWTDLGEPMVFDAENGVYHGFLAGKTRHEDVHNLYNLLWLRSIYEGYIKNNNQTRPFILSRSGGPGMQRYGAGMWSGDIPAKYENLAAHLNVEMHMVLSGIDYFSSDAGGFYRDAFPLKKEKYKDLFTRWYAISALIDFPLRPHADNLCHCHPTAPDRVGDMASNLANTRFRYQLIPYYYSLAHRAHLQGEPIIAPALYADEKDFELMGMASQKMIGPWLMSALESKPDVEQTRVYLPAGKWFDFRSNAPQSQQERWKTVSLFNQGIYQLPLFAKAGAIIPMAELADASVDAFARVQGEATVPALLKLKIFPGQERTEFTVFEDDGETNAYLQGALRRTLISQQCLEKHQKITIHAASGIYKNAPQSRDIKIILAEVATLKSVALNGVKHEENKGAPDKPVSWKRIDANTLEIRVKQASVNDDVRLEIEYR